MIKLINPVPINTGVMALHLQEANKTGVYSNGGKLVRRLEEQISNTVAYPSVTACNATVAIQLVKALFKGNNWLLPSFTFPATNVNNPPGEVAYQPPRTSGKYIGRSTESIFYSGNWVHVITVPFGDQTSGLAHQCTNTTIVDAAACASPSMSVIKEWLDCGAAAVIVSLHATKIWPAGEGAFVSFKSDELAEEFRQLSNFGIVVSERGDRTCSTALASNAKMSEVTAAAALSTYSGFVEEYHRRELRVVNMAKVCNSFGIDYIPSSQSFWIAPKLPWKITSSVLSELGIESRNYYWGTPITPHYALCERGVCIPVHHESIPELLERALHRLCEEQAC